MGYIRWRGGERGEGRGERGEGRGERGEGRGERAEWESGGEKGRRGEGEKEGKGRGRGIGIGRERGEGRGGSSKREKMGGVLRVGARRVLVHVCGRSSTVLRPKRHHTQHVRGCMHLK